MNRDRHANTAAWKQVLAIGLLAVLIAVMLIAAISLITDPGPVILWRPAQ